MSLNLNIKKIGIFLSAIFAIQMLFTSCDGVIYEDEGDCDVVYRVKFRYDMNMKYADAFAHEVKSVKLYVFDTAGKLVWQTAESGEELAREGYSIVLPLNPGNYRLAAWCGLDNGESFTVPEIQVGNAHEEIHCRLNRVYEGSQACSKDDLHALFHGILDVNLPDAGYEGGEFVYTIPLVKDTNVFRITLQHLSGEHLNERDFTFHIEDTNGWMAHDNSLNDDEPIKYHAWSVYSGTAGVDTYPEASRAIENVRVVVAELTVARLVERDWNKYTKPMLVVRASADGKLIARVPIIDYALLVKGEHNVGMSNQEFLDRNDTYNMTFFLDNNLRWLGTEINIHSWRLVRDKTELDS
ncbi:MAG: FimB/Mfa2 family fimbrial subunit [Muribaculum sp.]|nr:FimB/Mfa2 family fimbrial subunit [Muribaculaceae bacterium]MCM1081134.1 FimB/Mfa2 family fimbrial subunit [Muribaculum sp.]